MANRDPAANQLSQYKTQKASAKISGDFETDFDTTAGGVPLLLKGSSLTVGPRGPIVLHDSQLVEELAHFVRERIPERVVHARGSGAFGYFQVTNSAIRDFTSAKIFSEIGKKTTLVCRFSAATGEPSAIKNFKGMAVKFQTEDGIFDIIGLNTPVFPIRDPALYPSMVHSMKRNPKTHLPDPDMFWDFMSLRPETTHGLLQLFSDQGVPNAWRTMTFYTCNTFTFVRENRHTYCRFRLKSQQTVDNPGAQVFDSDQITRNLYNSIELGQFPVWTLDVQLMNDSQLDHVSKQFDPFDATKIWPESLFPYVPIGDIHLNRNPSNYFAEIEQLAFSPGNLVPGIEPSAFDALLHARIFAYPDAQRYRLGPNYQQLGPNRSSHNMKNFQRDGPQTFFYQGDDPVYYPNSFEVKDPSNAHFEPVYLHANSFLQRYMRQAKDDFLQPRQFFENLTESGKQSLAKNLAEALRSVHPKIQTRSLLNFKTIHEDLYRMIVKKLS